MPYISSITLPSGATYDIKDAWAREQITAITGGSAVTFKGVSSTALTDGGNENPTVDGNVVSVKTTGELYFYQNEQFIYGPDNKWHALGANNLGTLGDLAYKNTASASYTPAGSVSQPTFSGSSLTSTGSYTPGGTVVTTTASTTNQTATVSTASGTATFTPAGTVGTPTISVQTAGATTTIKNPTAATVTTAIVTQAPSASSHPTNNLTYYDVTGEVLSLYQIGYATGNSITTSNVTVKTGDAAYQSSQPTFSGTGVRLVTGNIAVPSSFSSTFTGTDATVSVTGTPAGTVSQPTFTGTSTTITVS